MDALTLLGIFFAAIAVTGGQYLHGGEVSSLINFPAFVIVVCGSVGAVMLQTPLKTFKRSIVMLPWIFKPPKLPYEEMIAMIDNWSRLSRKKGILYLENELDEQQDPFIRKCLLLLISGCDHESIRRVMNTEMDTTHSRDLNAAHVFESMGGYCPTIGILGAVLGLVHVMRNLADPSELGAGIAVAFIATIYGVALANLFFLPVANKLKLQIYKQDRLYEMILEGVTSIADGENPHLITLRLNSFYHQQEGELK